jgi:hypothetical protein
LSQRNGRHVLAAATRARPYRTRLIGRLILINEGFGGNAPDPSPFQGHGGRYGFGAMLCLASAISPLYCLGNRPAATNHRRSGGNVLSRALSCIRAATALAAIAVAAAGCAAANNATSSQASSQGEQPYKTMYGITSEGTTTDLYTEFFGSRQPPPAPTTAVATAQPVDAQPVPPASQNATAPGSARSGRTTAASRTPQPAPQPAPVQSVQVAQQPVPPAPAPEPDAPTAYGIPSGGHTTDLYTAIFGPRQSSGQ